MPSRISRAECLPRRPWHEHAENCGARALRARCTPLVTLPFDAGAFKSELYQLDVVEQETFDEMGHEVLTVRLPSDKLQQLLGQAGLEPNDVLPTEQAKLVMPTLEHFEQ